MEAPLTIQRVEKFTVCEVRTPSLMDPAIIAKVGETLFRLVDEEDRRLIILDFERVEYLSSQALGIIMSMHKKLSALPHSLLILVGIGPRLMELIKITRLDKRLTIRASQKEAIKVALP